MNRDQKASVIDEVAEQISGASAVYAVDYPGHGYSDIPRARYDAKFFADFVEAFLEAVDLQDLTLSGVSIGASVSLIQSAEGGATKWVAANSAPNVRTSRAIAEVRG